MTTTRKLFLDLFDRAIIPPPTEPPSVWVENHFVFNEEKIKGKFSFSGREYLRRPIDDNNRPSVREQTMVFGPGCGKTISYIVGISWKIKFKPDRGLYVMPSQKGEGGASNFVETRLIEDIKATPALAELLPKGGQMRFKVNKQHVRMAGSHYGFVGGNSATQVASNRCGDVRMDETDKFPDKIKNEAGTGDLVRSRTKGVEDFQIFDTSTPTIEGGIIWPRLQRSNLHLYFVPCPHCADLSPLDCLHGVVDEGGERATLAIESKLKGWMVYAWNEQFSAGLPRKCGDIDIPFAFVRWSPEAKARDGIWNLQKVKETAHFECPHCKGKIFDFENGRIKPEVKNWMDSNGAWVCVKPGVPGHVGYHASSLYAPVINEESTAGGYATAFLSAHDGGKMQDFINSTLALPEIGQQHVGSDLIEIGANLPRTNATLYLPMLSGDRQDKFPGFWFVVRNWIISTLRPLDPDKEKREAAFKLLPANIRILDDVEIIEQITRSDFADPIASWLLGNGKIGSKLREFFKTEFEGDLNRLIEFVLKELEIEFPRQGDSEALEVGSADSWEEIEEAQQRWKVANCDVIMDARFGSMDNSEVFAECFRRCPKAGFVFYTPVQSSLGASHRFSKQPMPGAKPFALNGWTPCMGFPEHKTWTSKEKIRLPYGQIINDPFSGKMEQKQFYQYAFQFDAQWALGELSRIRKKYRWQLAPNVKFTGLTREMSKMTLAEYNRHMKGYYFDEQELEWKSPAKGGGSQAARHPNHLYDCEKNMVARAVWKGVFKYEKQK